MKKYLLVLALGMVLSACGKNTEGPVDPRVTRFQIGQQIWQVYTPENWVKSPAPEKSEALFLSYHRFENFVIIRRTLPEAEDILQTLLQNARKDYLVFQNLQHEEGAAEWSFEGKIATTDPLRRYHQKIFLLEGGNDFLLGSCAYEIAQVEEPICPEILKRWQQEAVDKRAQKK